MGSYGFYEGEGFKLLDIMRTGEGTKDYPNRVFVTMSKWDFVYFINNLIYYFKRAKCNCQNRTNY